MIEPFAAKKICSLLPATSSRIHFERILFRDWVTILGGILFGFDVTLSRGKPLLQGHSDVLRVTGLSHRYNANVANFQIRFGSFSLDGGQALLLRGGSGAGKSTLLHLLCGVLPIQPESGAAVLCGQSLQTLTRSERDALRPYTVGWMPQRQFLMQSLTVLENVLLPALLAGRADEPARQRAMHLLQSFAIADLAHLRPQTLSVGQAARASLARALVTQPRLLLADEPTAALDAVSSQLVIEQIARYVQSGGAAIIASHDPAINALWDTASSGKAVLAEIELPR